MSREPPLREWIERLSDGAEIDWDQMADQPAPAAEAMLKLRQLSQITQAFRQGTPASANPSGVQSRFQWGHLQAIELIGEGSFGRVYRAYDQLLDRDVALKLRRDSDSGLASTRAFIAEARRLARVRHPNVLAVHGAGVHDNRVGLWADLLSGQTLAERIRHSPLSIEQVRAVITDVLQGLCAIHAAGLIHGDIKASNLMIEPEGRAVLMDFGAGSDSLSDDRTLNLIQGSPRCMAPELFSQGVRTQAIDLYSTGVLVFHLLSGRYPVEGETLDEIRAAHRVRTPGRAGQSLHGVPRELVSLVDDLLHPSADRRPSAAQALSRMQRWAAKPERRRRQRMVAAAMGCLLVALGISLYALHRVSAARAETELQYQQAERQRQHAVAVKDFLVQGVRASAPMQREGESSLLGVYRGMAARVDSQLQDFPEARAEMQLAIGRGLYDFGDHQAGVALAERGLARLRAIAELPPQRLIEPLETLAILYRHQKQLDRAEASIREALAIADKAEMEPAHRQALTLRARNLLANVLGDRGDLLGALAEHQRVLDERIALLGSSATALAANYNNIGRAYENLEQWPEALSAFKQAETILLRRGEGDSIRATLVRNGIAQSLIGMDQWDQGEALMREVRARFLRDYGAGHSFVLATDLGLAELARRRGDAAAALNQLQALHDNPNYEPSFYFWLHLSRAAADQHQWGRAAEAYRQAQNPAFADNAPYREFLRAARQWCESQARASTADLNLLSAAREDLSQRGLDRGVEFQLLERWLGRNQRQILAAPPYSAGIPSAAASISREVSPANPPVRTGESP